MQRECAGNRSRRKELVRAPRFSEGVAHTQHSTHTARAITTWCARARGQTRDAALGATLCLTSRQQSTAPVAP
eukprot:1276061-Rhodomonas_salina.1